MVDTPLRCPRRSDLDASKIYVLFPHPGLASSSIPVLGLPPCHPQMLRAWVSPQASPHLHLQLVVRFHNHHVISFLPLLLLFRSGSLRLLPVTIQPPASPAWPSSTWSPTKPADSESSSLLPSGKPCEASCPPPPAEPPLQSLAPATRPSLGCFLCPLAAQLCPLSLLPTPVKPSGGSPEVTPPDSFLAQPHACRRSVLPGHRDCLSLHCLPLDWEPCVVVIWQR